MKKKQQRQIQQYADYSSSKQYLESVYSYTVKERTNMIDVSNNVKGYGNVYDYGFSLQEAKERLEEYGYLTCRFEDLTPSEVRAYLRPLPSYRKKSKRRPKVEQLENKPDKDNMVKVGYDEKRVAPGEWRKY